MNKIEIHDAAVMIASNKMSLGKWDQLKQPRKDELTNRVIISMVITRLRGAAESIKSPEQNLYFQIVCTAIADSISEPRTKFTSHGPRTRHEAISAQRYFQLNNHAPHCEAVGLDPEYVSNTLKCFFLWSN
jgi:hypothetical protein